MSDPREIAARLERLRRQHEHEVQRSADLLRASDVDAARLIAAARARHPEHARAIEERVADEIATALRVPRTASPAPGPSLGNARPRRA